MSDSAERAFVAFERKLAEMRDHFRHIWTDGSVGWSSPEPRPAPTWFSNPAGQFDTQTQEQQYEQQRQHEQSRYEPLARADTQAHEPEYEQKKMPDSVPDPVPESEPKPGRDDDQARREEQSERPIERTDEPLSTPTKPSRWRALVDAFRRTVRRLFA